MKTLEVHEMLMKNQALRFTRGRDLEYFLKDGAVRAKEKSAPDCNSVLSTDFWSNHDDWELVPQEVHWKTAIQAWIDGDEIVSDFKGDVAIFHKDELALILSKTRLINGKWFIK